MAQPDSPELTRWTPAEVELRPEAVDPSWIVEGEPQWWTTETWSNADRTTVCGCFRSTPGKFQYAPPADEITFVRGGVVLVTAEDGSTQEFRAGDVMSIRAGASLVFDVREALEDTWVWSATEPIEG